MKAVIVSNVWKARLAAIKTHPVAYCCLAIIDAIEIILRTIPQTACIAVAATNLDRVGIQEANALKVF